MLKQANSSKRSALRALACLCAFMLFQPFLGAQAEEDGLDISLAYLDRAVAHYNAGDAESAMRSIEAGMLYSTVPADFFYLKAALFSDADSPVGDVLEAAYDAFAENRRWFRFEEAPAAVFAASLLADTTRFEEALLLLERFSAEVSADAAFLRCRIFYALGDFAQARNAIDAALRRWPSDVRFPLLFFQFEEFYRFDALAEESPALAFSDSEGTARAFEIALWIVRAWNLLANPDAPAELSLASVPFLRLVSPRNAARIISRIWNMGGFGSLSPQAAPFAAVEALRENIASTSEVLDAFFSFAESSSGIPLGALEYLCAFAADSPSQELREEIAMRLSGFSGVLSADSNGDFISDSLVTYRLGRPYSAVYDLNQDGYPDIIADCGFGEPVSILFPQLSAAIEYQAYPNAASVRQGDAVFTLRPVSLACAPLVAKNLNFGFLSPDFFFLSADRDFAFPREDELAAASVLKTETDAAIAASGMQTALRRETFYDENGLPSSAREIIDGTVVSRTLFRNGQSAECDRDDDRDGYFEKKIIYGGDGETLLVDTDGDMVFNYAEFTGLDGSARQSWFDAGGSFPSVQWVKMPDDSSSAVWLHPESGQEVTVRFSAVSEAEGSFSVLYQGETREILYDAEAGLWWLDEIPAELSPPDLADIASAALQLKQSELLVVFADVEFEDGFIRILKIGGYLFAETVHSEQAEEI